MKGRSCPWLKSLKATSIPTHFELGRLIQSAIISHFLTFISVAAIPSLQVEIVKAFSNKFSNVSSESLHPPMTSSSIPPLAMRARMNISQFIADLKEVCFVKCLTFCWEISSFLTVVVRLKNSQRYNQPFSSIATFLNESFSKCLLFTNAASKCFNISVDMVTLSKMTVLIGVMAIKSLNESTSINVGFGFKSLRTCNGLVLFLSCLRVAGIGKISLK